MDETRGFPTSFELRAESQMEIDEAKERDFSALEEKVWPLLDEALQREPRMIYFDHDQILLGLTESGFVEGASRDDLSAIVDEWVAANETN